MRAQGSALVSAVHCVVLCWSFAAWPRTSQAQPSPTVASCLVPAGSGATVAEVQKRVSQCREAKVALVGSPLPSDTVTLKAIEITEKQQADDLPAFPIKGTNWSLTTDAFLGLVRTTFGDHRAGTTDQFAALSGVGSGVKLRYAYVDAKGNIRELVGLSGGLYFEPKVPVSESNGSSGTAQTLSTMLVLSTFQYFYLGAGWKFASNEPAYDRGAALRNFMLVFALGADGNSLTR